MIGDNEELARLRTTLATAQAERDALAAELAVLRTPVTDDALVEVILTALIGEDDGEEGITHQITGKRSTIRKRARAVLAAIRARATTTEQAT